MPIIQTETGFVYKSHKNKTNKFKKFKPLLIFFMLVLLVVGCFYLSTILNFTSVFGLNNYEIFTKKNYFAVVVASGKTFAEVSNIATEIKQKKGAGYVLNYKNEYHVVANVYSNKEWAETVEENLKADYEARILTVELSNMVVNIDYSQQQIAGLKRALNLVNKAHENLYDLSVGLDKQEIMLAEVRQSLQVFAEVCREEKADFSNLFQNDCTSLVASVKIYYGKVISSLSTLLLSENLGADLKYVNCNLIAEFLSLQNLVIA